MNLLLSDNTKIKIETYENVTSGENDGGVRIYVKDLSVDDIFNKFPDKLSSIKILEDPYTDGDTVVEETVFSATDFILGSSISKDTKTGIVDFCLRPKGIKDSVAQNTADISAINEAIADLASSLSADEETEASSTTEETKEADITESEENSDGKVVSETDQNEKNDA